MKLGSQEGYTDENLALCKQFGVDYVDTSPSGLGEEQDGYWHADKLMAVREHVESFGLTLAAMHLPLTSGGIEDQVWPNIMLGTPERDRDIEKVCKSIEAAAKAGIPLLLYNLAFLPVVRTPYRTPGRGGVTYSHFDYEELKNDPPHPLGPVNAEMFWERITYFVERVIPVADGVQGQAGLPPARSGHAPGHRLSRHRPRAGQHRRRQALRRPDPQPLPRPELLPGHHLRDVHQPRAGLRRDPLLWQPQEDLLGAFPQYPRRLPQVR